MGSKDTVTITNKYEGPAGIAEARHRRLDTTSDCDKDPLDKPETAGQPFTDRKPERVTGIKVEKVDQEEHAVDDQSRVEHVLPGDVKQISCSPIKLELDCSDEAQAVTEIQSYQATRTAAAVEVGGQMEQRLRRQELMLLTASTETPTVEVETGDGFPNVGMEHGHNECRSGLTKKQKCLKEIQKKFDWFQWNHYYLTSEQQAANGSQKRRRQSGRGRSAKMRRVCGRDRAAAPDLIPEDSCIDGDMNHVDVPVVVQPQQTEPSRREGGQAGSDLKLWKKRLLMGYQQESQSCERSGAGATQLTTSDHDKSTPDHDDLLCHDPALALTQEAASWRVQGALNCRTVQPQRQILDSIPEFPIHSESPALNSSVYIAKVSSSSGHSSGIMELKRFRIIGFQPGGNFMNQFQLQFTDKK
jgi:hypothetical protein